MIDLGNFAVSYKEHINWLGKPWNESVDIQTVFQFFIAVNKNGGWARTVGLNNWEEILVIPNSRKAFEDLDLVSFERRMSKNWNLDSQSSVKLDYSLLKSISVTTEIQADKWDEFMSEDLVIFRDMYRLGMPKQLMSLDSISKNHGNEYITVLSQELNTSGFSVKTASKQKMKLNEYTDLMQKSYQETTNIIKFGVNIDFGGWTKEVDELRKCIPSKILWCSPDDVLRYLRQNILGMTLPQLYLKLNGCWTGGHEENLRFCSANINHGPSACEWWGLDSAQSHYLREHVKTDKGFDIYSNETLWWPDEIYCMSKGLTVYHVIQKPGDLIVVGSGTIHWVKSIGVTVNSAWNFGPKLYNNFKKSFERNCINNGISFKNLVPMHVLAMDLLNFELDTLDIHLIELLRDNLLNKANEELEEYKTSLYPSPEINGYDNVINCEICYKELLNYYYKCVKCIKIRLKGKKSYCFFCYPCAKDTHKYKCKGKIAAVQKFGEADFKKLLDRVEARCKGEDTGNVVEELKYPYDKNTEEGVYVSIYNGTNLQQYPDLSLGQDNCDQDSPDLDKATKSVPKMVFEVKSKKKNKKSGISGIKDLMAGINQQKIKDLPPVKPTKEQKARCKNLPSVKLVKEEKIQSPVPPKEEIKEPKTLSNEEDHKENIKNHSTPPKRKSQASPKPNSILNIHENNLNKLKTCPELPFKRSSEMFAPVASQIPLKIPKLA